VDVVGLSILSGAHLSLTAKVLEELKKQNADDLMVLVGGIVPERDRQALLDLGVAAVFTSGTPVSQVAAFIREHRKAA